MRAALDVLDGGLVGRDETGLGAPLDRHVADRHAALHRHPLDGPAAVLDDVALAAAGALLGDEGEDEVLGRDVGAGLAVDEHAHGAGAGLGQGLRGEHVLDLARADAEGEGAEGAVGGGVRVAADDRHARLGQAQLRAHDVDDALLGVAEGVQGHAELGAVLAQGPHLEGGDGVGDRPVDVGRGDVVVLGPDGQLRTAHGAPGEAEALERLGARDLVDEVQVDVEQVGLPVARTDHVVIPDLLNQSSRHEFDPSPCYIKMRDASLTSWTNRVGSASSTRRLSSSRPSSRGR